MHQQFEVSPRSGSTASALAARLQSGLAGLINVIAKGMDERLAPFSIDPISYVILAQCHAAGPTDIGSLRRTIPTDPGRMSRLVSALAFRNLVRKVRLQSDQRVVRVELTAEGEAMVPELGRRVDDLYVGILSGVSEEEFAGCMETVRKLTEGANRTSAGDREQD